MRAGRDRKGGGISLLGVDRVAILAHDPALAKKDSLGQRPFQKVQQIRVAGGG
jgi:hypothetical protein